MYSKVVGGWVRWCEHVIVCVCLSRFVPRAHPLNNDPTSRRSEPVVSNIEVPADFAWNPAAFVFFAIVAIAWVAVIHAGWDRFLQWFASSGWRTVERYHGPHGWQQT